MNMSVVRVVILGLCALVSLTVCESEVKKLPECPYIGSEIESANLKLFNASLRKLLILHY